LGSIIELYLFYEHCARPFMRTCNYSEAYRFVIATISTYCNIYWNFALT
jgi:hypothetical protein